MISMPTSQNADCSAGTARRSMDSDGPLITRRLLMIVPRPSLENQSPPLSAPPIYNPQRVHGNFFDFPTRPVEHAAPAQGPGNTFATMNSFDLRESETECVFPSHLFSHDSVETPSSDFSPQSYSSSVNDLCLAFDDLPIMLELHPDHNRASSNFDVGPDIVIDSAYDSKTPANKAVFSPSSLLSPVPIPRPQADDEAHVSHASAFSYMSELSLPSADSALPTAPTFHSLLKADPEKLDMDLVEDSDTYCDHLSDESLRRAFFGDGSADLLRSSAQTVNSCSSGATNVSSYRAMSNSACASTRHCSEARGSMPRQHLRDPHPVISPFSPRADAVMSRRPNPDSYLRHYASVEAIGGPMLRRSRSSMDCAMALPTNGLLARRLRSSLIRSCNGTTLSSSPRSNSSLSIVPQPVVETKNVEEMETVTSPASHASNQKFQDVSTQCPFSQTNASLVPPAQAVGRGTLRSPLIHNLRSGRTWPSISAVDDDIGSMPLARKQRLSRKKRHEGSEWETEDELCATESIVALCRQRGVGTSGRRSMKKIRGAFAQTSAVSKRSRSETQIEEGPSEELPNKRRCRHGSDASSISEKIISANSSAVCRLNILFTLDRFLGSDVTNND